jgi:PAS domain S-box-containing protein
MRHALLADTALGTSSSVTHLLLATVPAPAYACDATGRITYYNERAAQLWGRHPALDDEADVYCGAHELFTADGTPLRRDHCWMAEILTTGGQCAGREIGIGRPDGSRRTALAYGSVLRGNDGRIVGASCLLIDVTARESAMREALRTSEANFAAFFDSRAIGAVQVNSDGRFIRVNDRYCAITGYTREELLTMGPVQLTHPDDHADDLARLNAALANPAGIYVAEKRYVTKNGRSVWVQVAANFKRDEQGRPVETIAIVTDINERKRAEAVLQQADKLKDDFLATLAHELRNPLAPLQHAAEILRHAEIEETEWCRTVIDRQVSHLTRLIDDLLDLSRITRDKLELKKGPVELARVLDNAVEASRSVLEHHDQTLSIAVPAEPVFLEGDVIRLTQVFTNLLTNAAKFNEQPGTIRLRAAIEGDVTVVSVADRGIGIASDDLPRLFDKFYQSPRNDGRHSGGLGIGLSLVRRLVELHGGKVEARSAGLAHGSEFVVTLPGARRTSAAAVAADTRAEPTHSSSKRVLVVDDNCDAADSLGQLLELMGHATATAYSGESAITRATQFGADVVLLDLGMPGMDGYETCRRLRDLQFTAPPRIVAMTGWARAEDRARTADAGFDAHLVKPIDRGTLTRLLDENQASAI